MGGAQVTPPPGAGSLPGGHQPLLFAVLEQRSGQASFPAQHDTIAIVNVAGVAVAKQSFAPRALPVLSNAAPLLQPEARTAAGAVYYVDGKGVVRTLRGTGATATVATFDLVRGQQELAFAVSPDGLAIDATRLTLPPTTSPSRGAGSESLGNAPLRVELLEAINGGPVAALSVVQVPQNPTPAPVLQMVGWDNFGAIATYNTRLGTQQGSIGQWYGEAHHLNPDGGFISASEFGGPGCQAQASLPDGTVLCVAADGSMSVRDGAAAVLWSVPAPPGGGLPDAEALAPDGTRVAVSYGARATVYARAGASVSLPAGFKPQGWTDADTVIGAVGGPGGEMTLVHLSAADKPVDLGFKGDFAGVVQAAS